MKKIVIILLSVCLIFLFSNSNGFATSKAEKIKVNLGKVYYESNCVACHGLNNAGGSAPSIKKGATAGKIKKAIKTVPEMAELKVLPNRFISKIPAYLKKPV